MKPNRCFLLHLAIVLLSLAGTRVSAGEPARSPAARQLVTCGRERVFILDLDAVGTGGAPRKLWTWQAAGRSDLPAEYRTLFRSTDDCKPVEGGRRILITSSGGAVALVDREKDAVVFYGRAVNAHSADLLPGGRIAVAASVDPKGRRGDSLILFEISRPGQELWRGELPSGHGVVWDEDRQVLWALANHDIRRYQLTDWNTSAPKLTRTALIELPEGGGHELSPVPGTPFLAASTEQRCWLFNRDTHAVAPHPQLADHGSIKCISQHPITGQIAYVQADRPNWWSERIRFLTPNGTLSLAGEQFYKVRWLVP